MIRNLFSSKGFPSDVCFVEQRDRLIVKFIPFVALLDQRIVMSSFWCSSMDDNSFQFVLNWLWTRAEVTAKVQGVLKL